jgi:pimeloyl-ACP methyl ester carboxylesterase
MHHVVRRVLRALPLCLAFIGLAAQAHGAPKGIDPHALGPRFVIMADGRRENFTCIGRGAPTVVFEQGGEGLIYNWGKVQAAITAITRTCFHDRPGFGYSDPWAGPTTALTVTDDLHELLRRAHVRSPVILVGHSIGGFYATVYADRFLAEVAGMVLVDPGFSGQWPALSPDSMRRRERQTITNGLPYLDCGQLARAGKLTEAAPHSCFKVPPGLSASERAYFLHANTRPWWFETEIEQSNNYFPPRGLDSVSWGQERQLRRAFGDMPMVVLSSRDIGREVGETDAEQQLRLDLWLQKHRELAARSSRGEWRLAEGSGHFIQQDRPEQVIDAITRVVQLAREQK